jgi:pSer/pThr/pTyr-binding forkhead associated (FHA) protein
MVLFDILSGKKAGSQSVARRFPFRVGRSPANELQLDDDGVWDQHLTLDFNRREGFTLSAAPDALASVNGEPVRTVLLRGGDVVTVGLAKLRFQIAPARQRRLLLAEGMVWVLLGLATAGQLLLIYWLPG